MAGIFGFRITKSFVCNKNRPKRPANYVSFPCPSPRYNRKMPTDWNAGLYDAAHSFVWQFGRLRRIARAQPPGRARSGPQRRAGHRRAPHRQLRAPDDRRQRLSGGSRARHEPLAALQQVPTAGRAGSVLPARAGHSRAAARRAPRLAGLGPAPVPLLAAPALERILISAYFHGPALHRGRAAHCRLADRWRSHRAGSAHAGGSSVELRGAAPFPDAAGAPLRPRRSRLGGLRNLRRPILCRNAPHPGDGNPHGARRAATSSAWCSARE
jgi:hypothetical protein